MIQKLIACDIDGTLLPYGQSDFDPRLFDLIKKLSGLGVLFVPASGRTIQSLQSLFEPVRKSISYLSENGGAIWSGETPIAETPMPKDLLFEIAETIYNHPEMECYMTSLDQGYVYSKDPDYLEFFNENILPGNRYLASLDDLDITPVKITAFCDNVAERYLDMFNERFGDRVNIMRAGYNVIDFGIANKGYGLKVLAEYYGLTSEDVYAFGDNYNDKSMLVYAGHSYIMRTDDPVLLASANHVCDSVADELELIYRELEKEEKNGNDTKA